MHGIKKGSNEAIEQAQDNFFRTERKISIELNNGWHNLETMDIQLGDMDGKEICKTKNLTINFSNFFQHEILAFNFRVEY